MFNKIDQVFSLLLQNGPAWYIPEPTKSILLVKPAMVECTKARFTYHRFKVVTGMRYLGGYIGDKSDEAIYVQERVGK